MTHGTLKIHSENILPIIKKWMYSDKDIFVRELISNACDAIQKVKRLRDCSEVDVPDSEFRIDLRIDKEARTLTFSDTGIGMDAEEVEKYIAQIAFSGAEEFVEKYQSNSDTEQIIGHFGLGFYSAYMVADRVDIDTLSYKDGAKPAFWTCDGSPEYDLSEGSRETRGTTITLHISEDEDEFLEENRIRDILKRYCSFLPQPLYFNDEQINKQEPLWIKPPSECTDQDYLEFYRHLYPMEQDPLFWIHLNVDYPFHLQGILYFPKTRRDYEDNKHNIQLYCNRVFVSDDCKDVVPDFLLGLRGVVDSPDIPLNVSRSYLQVDRTVRQLSTHIAKKVADRLSHLHKNESEKFYDSWKDIEIIVKLGAMQDEKFYNRIKDLIVWQNTKGDWTTAEDYLERNKEKTGDKIFYTAEDKEVTEFLNMYEEQGIEVLRTRPVIDGMMINVLEGKLESGKFQRIDGAVADNLLDPEREKSILDADGKTEASKLASFVKDQLGTDKVDVEVKSLKSDDMPGFIVIDEDSRRFRDYMASSNPDVSLEQLMDMQKSSFVVNSNNKLMSKLPEIGSKDPELAKDITQHVYELALLSQREMRPGQLTEFVARSKQIMQSLADKVVDTQE